MERSCLSCGAVFKGSEENTLDRIRVHLKKCSKEKPYIDDEDADYYED